MLSPSLPPRASQCLPDACCTQTPTIRWDRVTSSDLAGYRLYYRGLGGEWQTLVDLPLVRWRTDLGVDMVLHPGVDYPVAVQRYLGANWQCHTVELAVKAYDLEGNLSTNFSNVISLGAADWWELGEVYD